MVADHGKDFDREYVKFEAKDHMDDIKVQKKAMKTTSGPGLKRFAGKELETVTRHKQAVDAHRLPVSLFGIVPLPPLAQPGAGWAHSAGDIHGTAMWLLLWLVGLHAAAALYHHHVRHDGALRRMLPSRET